MSQTPYWTFEDDTASGASLALCKRTCVFGERRLSLSLTKVEGC